MKGVGKEEIKGELAILVVRCPPFCRAMKQTPGDNGDNGDNGGQRLGCPPRLLSPFKGFWTWGCEFVTRRKCWMLRVSHLPV